MSALPAQFDEQQLAKACDALLAHHAKTATESRDLLASDPGIWLVVATKKSPESLKSKPVRIPLRFPILPEETEVCLFTKDPQREYKDKLEEAKVTRISKVLGVTKLKAKYKPYEAKRALCAQYGIFLADERILPVLPRLLGKTFFTKRRLPIPVNIAKGNLKQEISRALSSTYLRPSTGSCTSVKVGLTSMTPAQLRENLLMAIPEIVDHTNKKWKNIQSLSIKTDTSIALPIFNSLPDSLSMTAVGKAAERDVTRAEAKAAAKEKGIAAHTAKVAAGKANAKIKKASKKAAKKVSA